jgi:3-ketosteroid 9alpha-monooxygenase subunit B
VPDVTPHEIVVHLGGRTYRIAYEPGETLLEAMRRAGLPAPFLCEQAVCGTCMVRCLKGEVILRENHVLSDDDLAQGYRLACQGMPAGTVCEIEIQG